MSTGKDRKHTIKAARKFSPEQIREFLHSADITVDHNFLVHDRDLDCWFVQSWNQSRGEMVIEDNAFHLACVEYMKNHGYLSFDSMTEALEYAKAQGRTPPR